MKIKTMISMEDLRNNYFTCGISDAYSEMLIMFEGKSITGDDIATFAEVIKTFSDTTDTMEEIADKVFAVCTTFLSVDNE